MVRDPEWEYLKLRRKPAGIERLLLALLAGLLLLVTVGSVTFGIVSMA